MAYYLVRTCDCCGKGIGPTMFKYQMKAKGFFARPLDICQDCYNTITKTIRENKSKINKKKEKSDDKTPENNEDCISRKWLLENLEQAEINAGGVFDTDSDCVKSFIESAPSITPKENMLLTHRKE